MNINKMFQVGGGDFQTRFGLGEGLQRGDAVAITKTNAEVYSSVTYRERKPEAHFEQG